MGIVDKPDKALQKFNDAKQIKPDKDGKTPDDHTDKLVDMAEDALVKSIKTHQMKSTAKCTKDELKQLFTPLGEPVPGVEGKMGIYPSTGYGEINIKSAEDYSNKHKEVIPVAFGESEKKSKIIEKFLGKNTMTQKELYEKCIAQSDNPITPLSEVQNTLHNGEQSILGFGAKYDGGARKSKRKSKKSKKSKRKSKKTKRKTRKSKK